MSYGTRQPRVKHLSGPHYGIGVSAGQYEEPGARHPDPPGGLGRGGGSMAGSLSSTGLFMVPICLERVPFHPQGRGMVPKPARRTSSRRPGRRGTRQVLCQMGRHRNTTTGGSPPLFAPLLCTHRSECSFLGCPPKRTAHTALNVCPGGRGGQDAGAVQASLLEAEVHPSIVCGASSSPPLSCTHR